jgi:hypothetical protein
MIEASQQQLSSQTVTSIDGLTHPLTLRFLDQDLERNFMREYASLTAFQTRYAVVVTILLLGIFGILDPQIVGPNYRYAWLIILFFCIALFGL